MLNHVTFQEKIVLCCCALFLESIIELNSLFFFVFMNGYSSMRSLNKGVEVVGIGIWHRRGHASFLLYFGIKVVLT